MRTSPAFVFLHPSSAGAAARTNSPLRNMRVSSYGAHLLWDIFRTTELLGVILHVLCILRWHCYCTPAAPLMRGCWLCPLICRMMPHVKLSLSVKAPGVVLVQLKCIRCGLKLVRFKGEGSPLIFNLPKASRFLLVAGEHGASVRSIRAEADAQGGPLSVFPLGAASV